MKRTYISEEMNIELRFEMFNAFNRHIFGAPAANFTDSAYLRENHFGEWREEGAQFALKFNF